MLHGIKKAEGFENNVLQMEPEKGVGLMAAGQVGSVQFSNATRRFLLWRPGLTGR